jgi:hypothetical protein
MTRPPTINHLLCPDRHALRGAWPGESCRQVLSRDLPNLGDNPGHIHQLHAYL